MICAQISFNHKKRIKIKITIFDPKYMRQPKKTFTNLKDKWFYYFGSFILGHSISNLEDFGAIVDILIEM